MVRLFLVLTLVLLPLGGSPALAQEESREERRGPMVLAETRWVGLEGARPAGGRPEASTEERALGASVVWRGRRGGTWVLSASREEREDAGLTPLPGSPRAVGSFRALEFQGFHSRELARDRRAIGFLRLRGAAEDGADVTDAMTGILWYGRDRPTSSTTRFGWGLVAIHVPDEGLRVFPGPTFEWDPPGGFSLTLGGPRLELCQDLSSRWQLALGGGVRLRRYRLADGSLFVDRQVPVRLSLRRMVRGQVALEVFAGRLLGRSWEVLERPGLPDATLDVEGGTMVGFRATLPIGKLFGR